LESEVVAPRQTEGVPAIAAGVVLTVTEYTLAHPVGSV
jgi:hypothetical protein